MALKTENKKQQERVLAILSKNGHKSVIDQDEKGFYLDDFITYDEMAEIVDYLRESKNKYPELFEKCWEAYRRKGQKKTAKAQWDKLKDSEFEMVMPHIKAYVASREIRFQQDFHRYLRDRVFMGVVYDGNNLVYDPMKAINAQTGDAAYSPVCGGMLSWNEYYKTYMYTGIWYGGIVDGYTEENRPDGATVMLNNGRGKMVWNKESKEWIKA